jgi:hypothetical protein
MPEEKLERLMRDLLIIVPTRGRPTSMARLVHALRATSQAATDLVFASDDDDEASAHAAAALGIYCVTGPRNHLVGWTNVVARHCTGRYRALASLGDDHVPCTPGWDRLLLEAIDAMGGTGFAYGNDLLQGAALPTAVAVSSNIVSALGWMCEPSMRHYCIDNVWKDLGEGAGCLAYRPEVIIEHVHPLAGKADPDATHLQSTARDAEDFAAYRHWKLWRMTADIATLQTLRARRPVSI